jgi:hypothetical protein
VGGEREGEAGRDLTQRQHARNRRFGKVRAKVEHLFRLLKLSDFRDLSHPADMH